MPLILSLARNHLGISAALACDTREGAIAIIKQYDGPPSFDKLREAVKGWGDDPSLAELPFGGCRGPFGDTYSTYGLVITEDLEVSANNSPLSQPKPYHLLPLDIVRFRSDHASFEYLRRQGQIEVILRKEYGPALNTFAQCLADGRLLGVKGDELAKRLQAIDVSRDDVLKVKDTSIMAAAIAVHVLVGLSGFELTEAEVTQFGKSLQEMAGILTALQGDPEVSAFRRITGSQEHEIFAR